MGCWLNNRRAKKGKLSDNHVKRLEELGFKWNLHEAAFDEKFQRLKAYRKDHGHCNVKEGDLGRWVDKLRERKDTLSDDQVERLEELGFKWNIYEAGTIW